VTSIFRKLPSALFLLAAILIPSARAVEPLISTMQNVRAVMEARGFYLTPAQDLSGDIIPGDELPVMAIEIIRPRGEKVSIGRLFTSCSCIQLESDKRVFEEGERAVLRLRNIRPTVPAGQIYAIYVQLTGPIRSTLRYDTFLQSSRFIVQPEPVAAPVFADGQSGGGEEVGAGEEAAVSPAGEKDPLDKYSPAPEAADGEVRGETEAFKATAALLELKRREAAEAAEMIQKTETLLRLKLEEAEKAEALVKQREEELETAKEAVAAATEAMEEARQAAILRIAELKSAEEDLAGFKEEKERKENEARKAAVAMEALKEVGK
jgi:hypothetical protein